LINALRQYAEQHSDSNGLHISVSAPEVLPALPAAIEIAIYRITLEALTNVMRHAHAKNCSVSINIRDCLTLEIDDDGRGIAGQTRSGVGLNSMRERAAELGGTFSITQHPVTGTRVLATLPLPAKLS
jgi:signal transduction histidine kinase